MKKVMVIGCPGAGKSTFSRELYKLTKLPLYYLDMLWHKPDRTTISNEEFEGKLNEIIKKDSWIIDGNYNRTLEARMKVCDTVFFLDYPLEICLAGVESRIGKKREDLPWIEQEFDEEFKQWVLDFPDTQLPQIYELIDKYKDEKEILVFKSRKEADDYLYNASKRVYRLQKRHMAACIFADWEETIIWSCLQNVMGEIYVDDSVNPVSAMAVLGDFCFLAGVPDENLAAYKPIGCKQDFIIMIPQNNEWCQMIEKCYKGKAKKVERYAFKKEKDIFDKEALKKIVDGLSPEYQIKKIDESIFKQCKESGWSMDLVSQYTDYEAYQDHGLGVVILKSGEIVSGASSYASYQDGIEIEIDTKEEYRRRGLAYICGAKLILECLEKGIYPSWDAQNKWSVLLAEKLGYHLDHEYPAYEIWGY